jgi:hypothetical protein
MEILNLKGITGHGRNRIREHGHRWEIIERPKCVPDWPANHLMIRSLDTGETRWFDLGMDADFEISAP